MKQDMTTNLEVSWQFLTVNHQCQADQQYRKHETKHDYKSRSELAILDSESTNLEVIRQFLTVNHQCQADQQYILLRFQIYLIKFVLRHVDHVSYP